MQFSYMELSRLCKWTQRVLARQDEMLGKIIAHRVQNTTRRCGLPVIPFEFIAGGAAIDQVFQRVASALRTGLKMIYCQLDSGIYFPDATVPTSKRITSAHCLSVRRPHYCVAPALLAFRIAVICAFIFSRSDAERA